MSALFQQMGDMFVPTASREVLLDRLPTGNYIIVPTPQGLMIQSTGKFTRPSRLYGNVTRHAERILSTFNDRPAATGALLAGVKGSGKSLTAREVALLGYEQDIITIVVNIPLHGDAFNQLLASITQPAIVLFDEFEKVYSEKEAQESILTLLDGVMSSKKLFIMTVNNKWAVNDHMRNRPGRIFYSLDFDGLENEFIREYCVDNLDDTDQIDDIMKVAALFKEFNFDMLKAIVEEMNRYKETAFEVIEMLNAKPFSFSDTASYEVTATTPNGFVSKVETATDLPMATRNNSHADYFHFLIPEDEALHESYKQDIIEEIDADVHERPSWHKMIAVQTSHLDKLDAEAGRFEFVDDEGNRVVFQKKTPVHYSMAGY